MGGAAAHLLSFIIFQSPSPQWVEATHWEVLIHLSTYYPARPVIFGTNRTSGPLLSWGNIDRDRAYLLWLLPAMLGYSGTLDNIH